MNKFEKAIVWVLTLMLAITIALLVVIGVARGQSQINTLVSFLGMPCDPAANNFGFPCPRFEDQGLLIQAHSDDPSIVGYRVTVTYLDLMGRELTDLEMLPVLDGGWAVGAARIGRVKTAALPDGVTVRNVRIEAVRLSGDSVDTTIGQQPVAGEFKSGGAFWVDAHRDGVIVHPEAPHWSYEDCQRNGNVCESHPPSVGGTGTVHGDPIRDVDVTLLNYGSGGSACYGPGCKKKKR